MAESNFIVIVDLSPEGESLDDVQIETVWSTALTIFQPARMRRASLFASSAGVSYFLLYGSSLDQVLSMASSLASFCSTFLERDLPFYEYNP